MNHTIIELDENMIVKTQEGEVHPNFTAVVKAAHSKFMDCVHPEDAKLVRESIELSDELPLPKVIRIRTSVSSFIEAYIIPIPGTGKIFLIAR